MKKIPACASWGLLVGMILLSPVVLIFGLPLAVGIGLDIFQHGGETPFVVALFVPVAFAIARLLSPHVPQWLAALSARPHPLLGHHAKQH